jgi:orotate phosphoribosyltransferase
LLDDVFTGGGHLRAAAWTIEDQGRKVEHAICCGRSLESQLDDPFMVEPESIDISRA